MPRLRRKPTFYRPEDYATDEEDVSEDLADTEAADMQTESEEEDDSLDGFIVEADENGDNGEAALQLARELLSIRAQRRLETHKYYESRPAPDTEDEDADNLESDNVESDADESDNVESDDDSLDEEEESYDESFDCESESESDDEESESDDEESDDEESDDEESDDDESDDKESEPETKSPDKKSKSKSPK